MSNELRKDFPKITLGQFKEIIYKGIKGELDIEQKSINMRTIYQWFKNYKIDPEWTKKHHGGFDEVK